MKEKYIKLESVLAVLYLNKRIGNNGDINSKAITDILALPTEEIETIKVNQNSNSNILNDYDSRIEMLKNKTLMIRNRNSYILEACKDCSNHPSNGGSGNCNCVLGTQHITY